MGRDAREFTDDQRKVIQAMSGFGIPWADIARAHDCDQKTLVKHCKEELEKGHIITTTKVAETLYNQAMGGNTTALIFWLKCRARWSERHEITGADGEPFSVIVKKFVLKEEKD